MFCGGDNRSVVTIDFNLRNAIRFHRVSGEKCEVPNTYP
jgi:hypothetical protein